MELASRRVIAERRLLKPVLGEGFVCPSCRLQRSFQPARSRSFISRRVAGSARQLTTSNSNDTRASAGSVRPSVRHFHSTRRLAQEDHASKTAVNAPSPVPPALRELHQRLSHLQEDASSYINLSQLQLALRSLEGSDPVIRVAFVALGKNGYHAARQLARVLFSDALEDEQAWEKVLNSPGDERSILLKYGDAQVDSGVQNSTPLIKTLSIPSPLLRRLNLEILVTPLGENSASSTINLEETLLVPPVTISNSNAGRVGFVRHPVHRALIVGEGVSGAIAFGTLPSNTVDGETINSTLSIPLRSASTPLNAEADSSDKSIDTDLASHSISIFRADKANGAAFNREWQASRVPTVTAWLKRAVDDSATADGLKPAVQGLIEVLLTGAEKAVTLAESRAARSSVASDVSDATRMSLRKATATWSEEAHGDLATNLDTALDSATWRKTAWWRLLWRIDEVSLSASEVLVRGWLVEAEQTLAFLSGRVLQAGVASADDMRGGTVAEVLNFTPMLARVKQDSGLNPLFNPPWPQSIAVARQQMLHEVVPALHRRAQGLLVSVLSLMGGSGVLAGTILAASGGVALYEAGAVAALGFVWSLRRLQTKWSRERTAFTQTARENGRRVLIDVEQQLRALIEKGGRTSIDRTSEREWREARKVINACREAILRLGRKNDGKAL
ncbi:uncharacterized protein K489DRAFT_357180 [Dissoconium aciculare CBS 342.82]|uniref:Mmc1 C-terminal domain-containing protein n=1 Tax=Dissoconium aciculare CBS 342.82 TaxID=1314786 RepID=A0A6J3M601_9PEZI|nr:uncharacterized protein K489DRAFT_357180 [Dissoconium aciculare CBS 342.82]KAF1822959.1 hypothetical protein K489DRAFT_357180 [Dissoconium aciculare CBS 342.82]